MYLGTVRSDDKPSSNGSSKAPPPEEHKSAPGFVARSSSDADIRATSQRVHDIEERITHFKTACSDGETQIEGAVNRRDGIQQWGRGWPLLVVGVLAVVTVVLEYLPASLFTQIFAAKSNDVGQWRMLTVTFTAIPAVLAIAFGELVHRTREPARQRMLDTTLLIVTAIVTVAFLVIGYGLRVAYTSTSQGKLFGNLDPRMEAIALTSVAAIGIILTVVSSYYREGLEMFKVGRELAKHRRDLQTNEAHLKANERDLDRALTALYGPIPTRDQLSARAEAQRRADAEKLRADEAEQTAAAAKRSADAEQQRADAEKQRTDAEKQRIDLLKAAATANNEAKTGATETQETGTPPSGETEPKEGK